jgi:hypothetical protein
VPEPTTSNRTFDRASNTIQVSEGGASVSDDARDRGGLTRWGISQAAYPNLDIRQAHRRPGPGHLVSTAGVEWSTSNGRSRSASELQTAGTFVCSCPQENLLDTGGIRG